MRTLLLLCLLLTPTLAFSQDAPFHNRKPDPTQRMQMMITRYDANKDGVLTKDEFQGRAEHWRRMDANKDNKVDAADFAKIRDQRRSHSFSSDRCPELGDPAGDFTLRRLNSKNTVTLSKQLASKPVVLNFGSYTCPPFRQALEEMEAVYQSHQDDFHFFFIYIKEAHASDGRISRVNVQEQISIPQHLDFGARSHAAAMCQGSLKLTMPVLVDSMDNAMETRFDAWPNRCVIIDKAGKVAYKGVRGPKGTVHTQILAAIKRLGKDQ
jgi:hypothetical protein